MTMRIEELTLSVRAYNALKDEEIHTVERLCEHTAIEILRIPNFGKVSLQDVRRALKDVGRHLFGEEPRVKPRTKEHEPESLRDRFAMAAINPIISNVDIKTTGEVAAMAYAVADAMMKAREAGE